MTTIFIGGSRGVSRLSPEVRSRVDNVTAGGHHVVVGDAYGADKAVQAHLHAAGYRDVTVYCSGEACRNNVGGWPVRTVTPENPSDRGFRFHAAKDRAMAAAADFGLMIWDGESPGTLLNVLRLLGAGRYTVLFHAPDRRVINVKTVADWEELLEACPPPVVDAVRRRALDSEWIGHRSAAAARPSQRTGAASPRLDV